MKKVLMGLVLVCLVFMGCGGSESSPTSPPKPIPLGITIEYFTASPTLISRGETSTLSWSVKGADKVELWVNNKDYSGGVVSAKGTKTIIFEKTESCVIQGYKAPNTYESKSIEVEVRGWKEVSMSNLKYIAQGASSLFIARGKITNTGTLPVGKVTVTLKFQKKSEWGGGLYMKYSWVVAPHFAVGESFDWFIQWHYYDGGWEMCKYIDVNNKKYKITWN